MMRPANLRRADEQSGATVNATSALMALITKREKRLKAASAFNANVRFGIGLVLASVLNTPIIWAISVSSFFIIVSAYQYYQALGE